MSFDEDMGIDIDFAQERKKMVELHLMGRDITDERVLEVFGHLPREEFVWDVDKALAYADSPQRIGEKQTISQPYIVALMTQLLELKGTERVLEIGTGSGFQTAVLSELAEKIITIERFESLTDRAVGVLDKLGYSNIEYLIGDGTLGSPEHAPFDRIIVTAGAPSVPSSLKMQLKDGGIMVIPSGPSKSEELLVVKRMGDEFTTTTAGPCRFVKLVGEEGWAQDE